MKPTELPSFISNSVLRGRYFFIHPNTNALVSSRVACAGWEECSPEYEIRRADFAFPAVEYIAGGDWELETPTGKWTLHPGAVFTYGPGISYSLKPLSRRGLSKYFIDFTDQSVIEVLREAGLNSDAPGTLVQRRWLHDLLDQLIETSHLPAAVQAQMAGMIADLVLARIREDLRPLQLVSQAQVTYEQCRDYLAGHYLELAGLEAAARCCGISAVYLCRLFKRFGTETPQAFMTRLKINHAAERIVRSNLSVKAAAAEVGFGDAYHFSRVFKKVHGIAPSQFGRG